MDAFPLIVLVGILVIVGLLVLLARFYPGTGADLYPFFSRRIGLINGQDVPLDAGVKLTGTVGRTEVEEALVA